MKALSPLSPVLAALVLGSSAFGQGADLCANAQPVAGLGVFNFDNSAASTDGLPDPLCLEFGDDTVQLDVWFTWMAPTSGTFVVDTCGQTTVDTKIGIYDGSCAGTVLACNDDTCNFQSEVSWQGVAGQVYLIRVGCYPINPVGGTGTFTISEDAPVLNPVNGSYYQIIDAPGITWAQAMLDASNMTYQGLTGHLATITDQQENDFIFNIGDAHYRYIGGFQNLASPSYVEPTGGWEWITGEPFTYTNWWPGEPNDTGPAGAEDYLELLEGAQFGTSWNDTGNDHAHGYVVEFDGFGTPGTPFCLGDGTDVGCPCGNFGPGAGEGCLNSSGQGATLTSSGSASIASDDMVFDGAGLPANKPTLLFTGNASTSALLGDGVRCVGGQIQRYPVQLSSATGTGAWGPGLQAVGGYNSGETRYFQLWYRDPTAGPCGTGFNLSSGLSVTFVP